MKFFSDFRSYFRTALFASLAELDSEYSGVVASLRTGAENVITDVCGAVMSVAKSAIGFTARLALAAAAITIAVARVAVTLVFGPETEPEVD